MYAAIDIGNPRIRCELLKGNPRTLVCMGYNTDSRVQYMSCNGDSHVRTQFAMEIVVYATQHFEKLYSKLVQG